MSEPHVIDRGTGFKDCVLCYGRGEVSQQLDTGWRIFPCPLCGMKRVLRRVAVRNGKEPECLACGGLWRTGYPEQHHGECLAALKEKVG